MSEFLQPAGHGRGWTTRVIATPTCAILLLLLAAGPSLCLAADIGDDKDEFVGSFIAAVKSADRVEIAKHFRFPIRRNYPIPAIADEADFLKRFDQIIDDEFLASIANSSIEDDWTLMGWKGIMFAAGDLWMDFDGKVFAINYDTGREESIRDLLIRQQKSQLHPSLTDFTDPVLIAETERFRIRIDWKEEYGFRYVSWPVATSERQLPDLVLTGGDEVYEGSAGNHYYEFASGDYVYTVYVIRVGPEDSPPATLDVSRGDEVLLSQEVTALWH